jgi:peptidoglycan/LPS O-acetylase OafA/YrhL
MRFVAAAAVFVFHVDTFLTENPTRFPLGATAVSFFFVLSGYILTWVYHDRLRGKPLFGSEVGRFLKTRWARLWPLHLVCLGLAIGLSPFFHFSEGWTGPNTLPSLVANVLMLHAWIPVDMWFLDFNSVSWSISTELFFYLMFPLLFAGRRHFWLVLAATLALCLSIHQFMPRLAELPNMEWFSLGAVFVAFPPNHLWQFSLGMGLCLLRLRLHGRHAPAVRGARRYVRDSLTESAALGTIPLMYFLVASRAEQIAEPLVPAGFNLEVLIRMSGLVPAFGIVIYTFGVTRGFWSWVVGNRFSVWLGDISFAFYMVHQIILLVLVQRPFHNTEWILLSFVLSVVMSGLLFAVVEMPMKSAIMAAWDRRWPAVRRHVLSGLRSVVTRPAHIVLLVVFAVLAAIVLFHPHLPPDSDVRRILAGNQLRSVVTFDEEADLHGVRAWLEGEWLHLDMAWMKRRSHQRNRFLHVCDEAGRILRQPPSPRRKIVQTPPFQWIADRVVLPREAWIDGAYIGVGFWGADAGPALVLGAETDGVMQRLRVVELEPFRREVEERRAAAE